MGNPVLAHNMAYAAAHAMFYLVAGSHCVHALGEMEAAHATCESRVTRLERRLGELGEDLRLSEQKCELLSSEKTVLGETRAILEAKVDSLTQVNEGLMIQVECLERDAADRDKLISSLQSDLDASRQDLDWLVHVGVALIIDK